MSGNIEYEIGLKTCTVSVEIPCGSKSEEQMRSFIKDVMIPKIAFACSSLNKNVTGFTWSEKKGKENGKN